MSQLKRNLVTCTLKLEALKEQGIKTFFYSNNIGQFLMPFNFTKNAYIRKSL